MPELSPKPYARRAAGSACLALVSFALLGWSVSTGEASAPGGIAALARVACLGTTVGTVSSVLLAFRAIRARRNERRRLAEQTNPKTF